MTREHQRFGNRYKANAGADCVPKAVAYREYGSGEWSNGSGLEMYETFYRSYNAHNLSRRRRIGRFMQGDPKMEVSMESYVFEGNNPVMFTDLMGDLSKAELYDIINHLFDTEHGGQWSASDPGRIYVFGDEESGSVFGRMAAMGNPFDFGSEGRESGHNGVWSASGGFYDKGLYPEDAKWVKLQEVVVSGRKNNFSTPYENINEFFQDPYIIQNGKNIPLSTFDKGTQRFSHGYSSQTTLILNDGQLRNYLNQNRKYFDKVNNPLYAIAIGLAFVRANPWISGAVGTWSGLQSISMSEMSAKFNQVLIDYLSQNEKNGMYLIVRDVSYTPGWGAAVSSHSTGIQFYFPQGVLFREISYSFH